VISLDKKNAPSYMAFLKGLLLGFSMVIFVGPVFFTLLKTSLSHGKYAGLSTAFGIAISDVVIIFICLQGISDFIEHPTYKPWLYIGSGIFLLLLGVKYLAKPPAGRKTIYRIQVKGLISAFANGFLVNFINPFVFIVWLGIIHFAEGKYGPGFDFNTFLTGSILGIFILDSTKAIVADKLSERIKPQLLKRIYQLVGLVLIAFSIRLFYASF
jgi:threonine/homoserine/homoserine lactone efflux protein